MKIYDLLMDNVKAYVTLTIELISFTKAAFLWGDLDQDQVSKMCLDHGASANP